MDVSGRLSITPSDNGVMLVNGELDVATSGELDEQLKTVAAASSATLDLSGVSFVDSSGLRVLIEHHQRFESGGGRLALTNLSTHVDRLIEISGLTEHLHVG